MRCSTFLLSYLITFNMLVFAANEKSTSTAFESTSSNDELNKLIKIPGVQEKIDECKNEKKSLEELPDCIWKKLDDKTKELVSAEHQKNLKVNGNTDLSNNQTNIQTTYSNEKNPAYQKLSEIIGKNLKKSLLGENSEGKLIAIDHTKFHDLYKAELSKTVVDAFSSYCLETNLTISLTDDERACLGEKKPENTKCASIADKKKQSECMESISEKCGVNISMDVKDKDEAKKYREENLKALNAGTLREELVKSCMTSVPSTCDNKDASAYSKQKACTVVETMSSIRKNLAMTEKLGEIYKDPSLSTGGLQVSNLDNSQDQKLNTMEAITISSKDVADATKDSNEELKNIAEKCSENPNDPNCSKILNTNTKSKEDALIEFGMRQYAQEKEMESALDSKDKNLVIEYLKKIGIPENEISEYSKDENLEKIKDRIRNRFKDQKEALIKELAERVSKTTTTEDGKNSDQDKSKYKSIAEELGSKTNNLKNLVRFNNIASSYLDVEQKGASRTPSSLGSNTTSIKKEFNSDKDNNENQVLKNKYKDKISANSDGNSVTIELKDLNEMLGISLK